MQKMILKGGRVLGKAILLMLLTGGILVTGAVAPNVFSAIGKLVKLKDVKWMDDEKARSKKIKDVFLYLRKKGYIRYEYRGQQLHISLTPEGKKRVKRFQIDTLSIDRGKAWDHKWRMVLFDVEEERKMTREALRGKLKELGFFQIQKSVWVHAFPCEKELRMLQEFFGLEESQYLCFEFFSFPKTLEQKIKLFFRV